ncbi:hypothetical protein D3C83_240640 [compost metagenome]
MFLKLPTPIVKNGEMRWSAQGSVCRLTCQKVVPENMPCTWPSVASMPIASASL